MRTTELKISEEPLAERVLRQVRSGKLDEARLLPSAEGRGGRRIARRGTMQRRIALAVLRPDIRPVVQQHLHDGHRVPPRRRVQRRDAPLAPPLAGAPGLSGASRAFVTASPCLAHLLGEAADVVADDAEFEDHQQVVDRGNDDAGRREYRYLYLCC